MKTRLDFTSGKESVWLLLRLSGLALMLLFGFSGAAQAQLTNIGYYTTSDGNGGLIITGFSASGSGPLSIPSSFSGLTVTGIGTSSYYPFYRNTNLTSVTIPSSVTSVAGLAFAGCPNLTSVTIGTGVASIGLNAFEGCAKLTAITVASGNAAFSNSVDGVLFNNNQTTLIQCPGGKSGSYTIPNSVTSIGDYAFDGCAALTTVTIPSSVNSIATYVFSYCTALSSVNIANGVTSIGNDAFFGCSNLQVVLIPKSVTSIGNQAFSYCTHLMNVVFAGNAPTMGTLVFSSTFSSFAVDYFNGSTGFTSPTWTDSSGDTYASANLGVNPGDFITTTSNGKITITGYTGYGGAVLIPTTINGQTVVGIGASAFQNCASLTSVTVPSDVTNVGAQAFNGCTNLASAVFAGNAPTMGLGVFGSTANGFTVFYCYGATGFTSPTWTDSSGDSYPATSFANPSNFTTTTSSGQVTITGYNGPGGTVLIPPTINGLPVTSITGIGFDWKNVTSIVIPNGLTSIGNDAFYQCTELISVTIPPSVISIGQYAFCSCTSLIGVKIPPNVASIGGGAFGYCTSLPSIAIPSSVSSIVDGAFGECTSLAAIMVDPSNSAYSSSTDGVLFNKNRTTLLQCPGGKAGGYTIPSSVTTIEGGAFAYCTSLTGVTIPIGVTYIGQAAFECCTSLTNIAIPNGVASVEAYTFYECTSLTSATIPNTVTWYIGNLSFYGCSSLTSVTIPYAVGRIGDDAFEDCPSLQSAIFAGNAPTIGSSSFGGVATGFTIFYYYGTSGFTSPTWTDSSGQTYPAIEITTPTFAQWVVKYGLTGGATGTPQNDGVSNQIKYLLDINPTQQMSVTDKAALPASGMSTILGVEYLTLTYRQSQTTSGLVVTPQVSTNLQNWVAPGVGSQTVQVGTDAATGDPMMQVQVPVSGPKMFVRLSLTGS